MDGQSYPSTPPPRAGSGQQFPITNRPNGLCPSISGMDALATENLTKRFVLAREVRDASGRDSLSSQSVPLCNGDADKQARLPFGPGTTPDVNRTIDVVWTSGRTVHPHPAIFGGPAGRGIAGAQPPVVLAAGGKHARVRPAKA